MSKFKIGQKLKTNEQYKKEYKQIFCKEPKEKGGIVIDIYEDGKNDPIYYFTKPDIKGNRDGLAERFVELV